MPKSIHTFTSSDAPGDAYSGSVNVNVNGSQFSFNVTTVLDYYNQVGAESNNTLCQSTLVFIPNGYFSDVTFDVICSANTRQTNSSVTYSTSEQPQPTCPVRDTCPGTNYSCPSTCTGLLLQLLFAYKVVQTEN